MSHSSVVTRDFLQEVLGMIKPFIKLIDSVMLTRNATGDLTGRAYARDSSVMITFHPRLPIEAFEHISCLNNLDYLDSVLRISQFQTDDLEIVSEYGQGIDDPNILRSMTLKTNRVEVVYIAKDPQIDIKIGSRVYAKELARMPPWMVEFAADKTTYKEFEEISRMYSALSKDTMFLLSYENDAIKITFGEDQRHPVSIVLIDGVKDGPDAPMALLFDTVMFKSLLSLGVEHGATIKLAPKHVGFEVQGRFANFKFQMAHKIKTRKSVLDD